MDYCYFLDTNALIEFERADDVIHHYPNIVVSSETLRELETIKVSKNKDEHVKQRAKNAVKFLSVAIRDGHAKVVIYNDRVKSKLTEMGLEEANIDNRICACAASFAESCLVPIIFVTADLYCQITAKQVFRLSVAGVTPYSSAILNRGYQLLKGNSAEILEAMSDQDFMNQFAANEFLLTYNTDTDAEGEMRFDGEKFVALKLPPSKIIKGRNALQRCALDLLNNQEISIVAILGTYGSGKTALVTRMASYSVRDKGWQNKILYVRSPWGEGREVGYLAGSYESKVSPFSVPIEQQLDGGSFELASLTQQGVFEFVIPYYLKGTTYQDTYILVDEAEDLTRKELKLVGTRVGEGGRVILNGDISQSLLDTSGTNPLIEMCNQLRGNKKFGCIYLNEDVRSATSKMFADLWVH